MRVLIDTNIIIYREDNKILSQHLQQALSLMASNNVTVVIHPLAVTELNRDKNEDRKEIIQSKLKSYPELDSPPDPELDRSFRSIILRRESEHEIVDDNMLYCVYRDAVDILLTHDSGIKEKSQKLSLQDRVFNIEEILVFLRHQFKGFGATVIPVAIKHIPLHNLNLDDPFFDQLKHEYPEFSVWYKKKSKAGEKAWVYQREDNSIGAFLLLKKEDDLIELSTQILPKTPRIKISTLKVAEQGYKLGELFIKIAIEFAVSNAIDDLYLTHFLKAEEEDYLVPLIEEFGFKLIGKNGRGEHVYLKKTRPTDIAEFTYDFSSKYYPSLFDREDTNKFIVPIAPKYHRRLFPELNPELNLFAEGLIAEGNSIKKAYLCHAATKKIKPRDIIFFYRSGDQKAITTIGVVEKAIIGQTSWQEAVRMTSKRTVYSEVEIKEILSEETLIMLFWWHFHLKRPIHYTQLLQQKVLKGPPQSILMISNEQYLTIKRIGSIDERYTFN
jgi:hypothetical protein